jgi:hypothetical protein
VHLVGIGQIDIKKFLQNVAAQLPCHIFNPEDHDINRFAVCLLEFHLQKLCQDIVTGFITSFLDC